MNETLYQALTLVIPMIFAIVFHEVAHGLAARALGDPTAAEQNRLSLNPIRHVDLWGTIIVPGVLKLLGGPVFGWAKPVPVNKYRLRNPRFGMMAVAAAGPASNLVMAALGAIILGLMMRGAGNVPELGSVASFIAANLINFMLINVFLALFNLLPIPPFDGSHIVEGLLPPSAANAYGHFRRYGMLLVLLLIVVLPQMIPGFDPVGAVVMPPFEWAVQHYFALVSVIAGG